MKLTKGDSCALLKITQNPVKSVVGAAAWRAMPMCLIPCMLV
jgi:hypothetical protein